MDKFEFKPPVFVIVMEGPYRALGLVESIAIFETEEQGNTLALFTDADLAQRFMADVGWAGHAVVPVNTAKDIRSTVTDVKKVGVRHVGIDLCLRTSRGRFYPAVDFLNALPP